MTLLTVFDFISCKCERVDCWPYAAFFSFYCNICLLLNNTLSPPPNTPQVNVLNCLEQMGYRVVTSGAFVATQMVISDKNKKLGVVKVGVILNSLAKKCFAKTTKKIQHTGDTKLSTNGESITFAMKRKKP